MTEQPEPDGHDPMAEEGCGCAPQPGWVMEVDSGGVLLSCRACGKSPPWNGDWQEMLTMAPLPVRVEWEGDCIPTCTCNQMVQWGCDGNVWLTVTPEREE